MRQEIERKETIETDGVSFGGVKIKTTGKDGIRMEDLDLTISNFPDQGLLMLNFLRSGSQIFQIIISNGKVELRRKALWRCIGDKSSLEDQALHLVEKIAKSPFVWTSENQARKGQKKVEIPFGDIEI